VRVVVLDEASWVAVHAAVSTAIDKRVMNVSAAPLLSARDALNDALPEDRAVHEIAAFLDREYEWPEVGYRDWCSVALDALTALEKGGADGR
jgi:hypothetical protein